MVCVMLRLSLVALIENPLLDPLAADQSRLGQDLQMLADGRLAYAELFGDQHRAHSVIHEIAVDLLAEMAARILQPVEDLEALVAGKRAQRLGGIGFGHIVN